MLIALTALLLICCVHLFAYRLAFLNRTPRSRWLSVCGGISLSYVFLHFMPELAEGQRLFADNSLVSWLEFDLYGLALIGLLAFYGLERAIQLSNDAGRTEDEQETHYHGLFWVHLASFATYNVITGYLLTQGGQASQNHGGEAATDFALLTFALAMALHFLVTDFGLRKDFKRGYMMIGRFVLCVAIIAGFAIGVLVDLPEIVVLGTIALLGGGVILNVLKEELPAERQSRYGAMLLGAAAYAALLALGR